MVQVEDGFSPDVIRKMREMGYDFDFVSMKGELREGYGAAVAIDGRRVTAVRAVTDRLGKADRAAAG